MTPQQAQAQALIREIDSVLNKASPRLPWVMTNEDAQQRQLLHQLRAYLASSLQSPSMVTPQREGGMGETAPVGAIASGQLDVLQQTLHAMMQEMNHLRNTVLQPLQADVAGLQQQRDFLRQEVEQLERQRQAAIAAPPAPPQAVLNQQVLHDVLQLLIQRLQESLSQQITQQIQQAYQHLQATLPSAYDLSTAPTTPGMLVGATEAHVQNLAALQTRSDQILSTIDTTLRVVFESIQRNLESYQESLARGLERMHGLGQQSEAQFAALLNHLAQRLGQEASTYLQSSLQSQGLIPSEPSRPQEPVLPASPVPPSPGGGTMPSTDRSATDTLPFAGTELGATAGALNPVSQPSATSGLPTVPRSETLHLDDLDLSDFNLDALDTSLIDAEESDLEALLSVDKGLEVGLADRQTATSRGAESPQPETPIAATPSSPGGTDTVETLDFLNQLAETLDAPPLAPQDTPSPLAASATDWTDGDTAADLRELYQSLFGSDEFASATPTASPMAGKAAAPTESLGTPLAAPDDRAPPTELGDRPDDSPSDNAFPTLTNLFGQSDATIHPDSFERDTAPQLADSFSPETGIDLDSSLNAVADLGADLEDLPNSLEDFFFPDETVAGSPVGEAEPSPVLPDEAVMPELESLTLEDLSLGEGEASRETVGFSDRPSVPPAPPSRDLRPSISAATSDDLPDLETDPFNLEALAAELGEPTAPTADLADLFAGLEPPQAPVARVPGGEALGSGVGLEESFDAAAPDENLLTDEALQPTASLETLQVDENTLQQLSEDLFSLESGEFGAAVLPPLAPLAGAPGSALRPDAPAAWTRGSGDLADEQGSGLFEEGISPLTEAGGPDLSVEDLAADLFGGLDEAADANQEGAGDPPLPTAPWPSATPGDGGDIDLASLEELFSDREAISGGNRGTANPGPAPESSLDSRPEADLLEGLLADSRDLDPGSQTAENSLASFQAEFLLADADNPTKKKF